MKTPGQAAYEVSVGVAIAESEWAVWPAWIRDKWDAIAEAAINTVFEPEESPTYPDPGFNAPKVDREAMAGKSVVIVPWLPTSADHRDGPRAHLEFSNLRMEFGLDAVRILAGALYMDRAKSSHYEGYSAMIAGLEEIERRMWKSFDPAKEAAKLPKREPTHKTKVAIDEENKRRAANTDVNKPCWPVGFFGPENGPIKR